MKLIKLPFETKTICYCCECEFEFGMEDLKPIVDFPDANERMFMVLCPLCSAEHRFSIKIPKDNIIFTKNR